jgi:hypothetical protein
MTDRELLELAAKAVGGTNGESNGLFYQWHDLPHTGVDRVLRYCGQREWNPLKDDGDALRLAVRLGLEVSCDGTEKMIVGWPDPKHPASDDGCIFYSHVFESKGADHCAATRRAIVRAAAEIGKGM